MLQSFEEIVSPTWPQLLTEFIAAKPLGDWNEKTAEDALNAHTLDTWRNRRIDHITSQEIKNLVTEKVGHRSQGTQQNLLKYLRGAFQYAVDMRYLPSNPAPTIRFKSGDKIKAFLKEDEVKFFLSKAKEFKHDWYYHWCLAIYTEMRNGETLCPYLGQCRSR